MLVKEEYNSKSEKIKLFFRSLSTIFISIVSTLNLLLFLAYILLLLISLFLALNMFLNGVLESNLGLLFSSVIPVLLIIALTYLFYKYIGWFYKWVSNQIK